MLVSKVVFDDPIITLLKMASRENGTRRGTALTGIFTISAYSILFLVFPNNPEVFTSSILVVAWGDGAGELIGKPYGKHQYHI